MYTQISQVFQESKSHLQNHKLYLIQMRTSHELCRNPGKNYTLSNLKNAHKYS